MEHGYGGTGIVHKHIKPAEGRDGFFNRVLYGAWIRGVRQDREPRSASALNLFDNGRRRVRAFGVRKKTTALDRTRG